MQPIDVSSRHPRLFHVTSRAALPLIERYGLLSAEALLDLYEIGEPNRSHYLLRRRSKPVYLRHPVLGTATLSDNSPLSEKALANCLVGMTVSQWLSLLNRKVFFWTEENYAQRLAFSVNNKQKDKAILVFDTKGLAEAHFDTLRLCPLNAGATRPNPSLGGIASLRGTKTFSLAKEHSYEEWRRLRGAKRPDKIKEITIEYAVPDAQQYVTDIQMV